MILLSKQALHLFHYPVYILDASWPILYSLTMPWEAIEDQLFAVELQMK